MANKTQKFETSREENVDFAAMSQEELIAALTSSSQQLKKESEGRKALANEVLDVKGNIRVFCRIRPFLAREKDGGSASLVKDIHDGAITIYNPQTKRDKSYSYDAVLGMDSSQNEAFEETRPVVLQILDGFNVCVFAYGQTGSGKTFTMIGEPGMEGINGQSAKALFEAAGARADTTEDIFQMSMFEIYNEQINDLLIGNKAPVKLDIKATSQGMIIDGMVSEDITTFEQMEQIQNRGFNARHTGKTNMNEHSSRSHCLTLINVTSRNKITGVTTWGKLYLIDLAGSERINRSGVTEEGLKEAQHINTSLSALTTCILALHKKDSHIPYRNSKLTHILQDSLGGSAKTMCFVNISPSGKAEDANETESSLRFASRVRKVELGQAKKQVDNSDMVKYKRMYEEAQQELDDVTTDVEVLKSKVADLEAQNNELSEALGQSDGELSMIKMDLETKTQEAEESSLKAQATLEELTSVQSQLDERNAELEATLEAYGEAQDDFTKVKNNLESELEHSKVKMQALEATSSALNETQSSLAELQADKAAAEMRVDQLTTESSSLAEKCKSLEAELKRTKTERDESQADLEAMRQQSSNLSEQRAELEQKLSVAAERSAELEENTSKLTGKLEEAEQNISSGSPRHGPVATGSPGESAAACGLSEEEMMQGNQMMVLLDAYTSKVEEQIDAQQKLIVMLNEDEEEDDEDEGEREEIMAQLEEQMYETEDEKSAARVKAIAYAREINLIFKRNDDEKLQMQRQYKFQFARAKAAFDVVKDKLMKNIQERASALKAVRSELETKEQALRRTQRQKQEAERGLLEMRCIFEDMKRIEHMKRGCEVLKYHQGGGAPQIRWVQLAHDEQELRWAENRKSSSFSSIPIREIADVLIGWESEVFKKCGREMLEKPWKCVSVAAEKRSFDFSLKTEDDVITWCRGLMALVCIRPGRTAPSVESMKKRILQLREAN
eukprot:TRINITY_DN43976_c0_g1_i1.p1 TRINITY_DN43976_c0_g1~~TRINITY_DN43976_c0_g1_i1.p1  ORF type:complete len:960 (-),score=392.75 TRINITY_DN43976_c0_g1_i1:162-3041(-)